MKRGMQGKTLVQRTPGESFNTFVPKPLPPDPPLQFDLAIADILERANRALGRLDGLAVIIPDISLFLYFYVRKEAVLSSQIEGTQSSLSDLLMYENEQSAGVPLEDVQEVSNYVAALNLGMERIGAGQPLTLRLLREIHEALLSRGRGAFSQPGEFRKSQNWIGGTRHGNALFVPPPPYELMDCLSAWEKYLHDIPSRTPTLIKAALLHVQFETIHPFLDGNGRLGRLVVTLLLCYERALKQPLLYLSLYLKQNRSRYYELLQSVRLEGDWEEWLVFFLTGVAETAEQATETAEKIVALIASEREQIEGLGRVAGSVLRLHQWMQKRPVFAYAEAMDGLGLSLPTVIKCVGNLKEMGIVREVSGRQRGQVFIYQTLIDALNE